MGCPKSVKNCPDRLKTSNVIKPKSQPTVGPVTTVIDGKTYLVTPKEK
jgi:hypothetical protein